MEHSALVRWKPVRSVSTPPMTGRPTAPGSASRQRLRRTGPALAVGRRRPTRTPRRSSRTSPAAPAWAPVTPQSGWGPETTTAPEPTTTRARPPTSDGPAPAACSPQATSACEPRSPTPRAAPTGPTVRHGGPPSASAWPPARAPRPGACLILCPRVPAFRARARDRVGLSEEPAPVGVLEIEDRVQRPVEVIREAGRLAEQLLGRRPDHSPNRPSSISVRSTSNLCEQAGQLTTPTASPSPLSRSYNRCR